MWTPFTKFQNTFLLLYFFSIWVSLIIAFNSLIKHVALGLNAIVYTYVHIMTNRIQTLQHPISNGSSPHQPNNRPIESFIPILMFVFSHVLQLIRSNRRNPNANTSTAVHPSISLTVLLHIFQFPRFAQIWTFAFASNLPDQVKGGIGFGQHNIQIIFYYVLPERFWLHYVRESPDFCKYNLSGGNPLLPFLSF